MSLLRRDLVPPRQKPYQQSAKARSLRSAITSHPNYDASVDEEAQRLVLNRLDRSLRQELAERQRVWEEAQAKGKGHLELLPSEVLNLIFWHLREALREEHPRQRHADAVSYTRQRTTAAEELRRLIPVSPRFAASLRRLYWQEIDFHEVFDAPYEKRVELFQSVGPLVENLRIPLAMPLKYLTTMCNLRHLDVSVLGKDISERFRTSLTALCTLASAISPQLEVFSLRSLGEPYGVGNTGGAPLQYLLPSDLASFTSLTILKVGDFALSVTGVVDFLVALSSAPTLRSLVLCSIRSAAPAHIGEGEHEWTPAVKVEIRIKSLVLKHMTISSPLVRGLLQACAGRLRRLVAHSDGIGMNFDRSSYDARNETPAPMLELRTLRGDADSVASLFARIECPNLTAFHLCNPHQYTKSLQAIERKLLTLDNLHNLFVDRGRLSTADSMYPDWDSSTNTSAPSDSPQWVDQVYIALDPVREQVEGRGGRIVVVPFGDRVKVNGEERWERTAPSPRLLGRAGGYHSEATTLENEDDDDDTPLWDDLLDDLYPEDETEDEEEEDQEGG